MFWTITKLVVGSKIGRRVSAILSGLLLVLVMIWKMRSGIRHTVELENKVERLQGAVKADERMDHADTGDGVSDADNRDWLRKRGSRRGKPRS